MTDTIASRVTRVVSGSVHALLDAVESAAPEATMAQAIREVDRVIDDVRAELGRVEASLRAAEAFQQVQGKTHWRSEERRVGKEC